MKLGIGLYRHQLDDRNLRFARQCGATHLVVHLVDYFRKADATNPSDTQPTGGIWGWGQAGDPEDPAWSLDGLLDLRSRIEANGLKFHAVENLDPAVWHDVLLAGPKRDEQLERVQQIIRNLGFAGVEILGYNFSLAGVYGRSKGPYARGNAESVGLEGTMDHTPVPQGMIWNMIHDPARLGDGPIPPCSHDELWDRVRYFLEAVLPVAEQAGVRLAAHPDDPPLPEVRGTPRLVYALWRGEFIMCTDSIGGRTPRTACHCAPARIAGQPMSLNCARSAWMRTSFSNSSPVTRPSHSPTMRYF